MPQLRVLAASALACSLLASLAATEASTGLTQPRVIPGDGFQALPDHREGRSVLHSLRRQMMTSAGIRGSVVARESAPELQPVVSVSRQGSAIGALVCMWHRLSRSVSSRTGPDLADERTKEEQVC